MITALTTTTSKQVSRARHPAACSVPKKGVLTSFFEAAAQSPESSSPGGENLSVDECDARFHRAWEVNNREAIRIAIINLEAAIMRSIGK
jgi:hypothetical protein